MKPIRICAALFLVLLAIAGPDAFAQVSIDDPGQGPVTIADLNATGASELSGLVKLPSGFASTPTVFQAVGDNATSLFNLTVSLNGDGTIASAGLVSGQPITGTGGDLEGVAYVDAGSGLMPVVVSEAVPEISLIDPNTFAQTAALPMPAAYTASGNYSASFGLESLAAGPGGQLYTANEQALTSDASSGWVRIQSYAPNTLALSKQVAYEITSPSPDFSIVAANGVVDIAVLPNGDLLVLERALGLTQNGLQTRTTINHITTNAFAAASDTLADAALDGTETAVVKTELWREFFSDQNYEGIALGQTLSNGDLSLLLVSDDGPLSASIFTFNPQQTLHPLVVTIPEPSTTALFLGAGAWMLRRR